jgi:hypothetical protein
MSFAGRVERRKRELGHVDRESMVVTGTATFATAGRNRLSEVDPDSNSGKGGPDRDGCAVVIFALTPPNLMQGSVAGAHAVIVDWDIQSLVQGGGRAMARPCARADYDVVPSPKAAQGTASAHIEPAVTPSSRRRGQGEWARRVGKGQFCFSQRHCFPADRSFNQPVDILKTQTYIQPYG